MSLRSALFLKPIGVLAVLVFMTLPSPTRGQGKCMGGMVNGTWPCDRVELIAHLPNASMGGMNANDLWGWTDPMDTGNMSCSPADDVVHRRHGPACRGWLRSCRRKAGQQFVRIKCRTPMVVVMKR